MKFILDEEFSNEEENTLLRMLADKGYDWERSLDTLEKVQNDVDWENQWRKVIQSKQPTERQNDEQQTSEGTENQSDRAEETADTSEWQENNQSVNNNNENKENEIPALAKVLNATDKNYYNEFIKKFKASNLRDPDHPITKLMNDNAFLHAIGFNQDTLKSLNLEEASGSDLFTKLLGSALTSAGDKVTSKISNSKFGEKVKNKLSHSNIAKLSQAANVSKNFYKVYNTLIKYPIDKLEKYVNNANSLIIKHPSFYKLSLEDMGKAVNADIVRVLANPKNTSEARKLFGVSSKEDLYGEIMSAVDSGDVSQLPQYTIKDTKDSNDLSNTKSLADRLKKLSDKDKKALKKYGVEIK